MLVIIKKDDSMSIPREVADMAEARALAASCSPMRVYLAGDNGEAIALIDSADPETVAPEPEVEVPADPQTLSIDHHPV